MEVSAQNFETELSNCSISETDITLNSLENVTILEKLITAIGSSFESTLDSEDDDLSVKTAESFDMDVRAYAEPSLPTSAEYYSFKEDYEIYDFKNNHQLDQDIIYNSNGDIKAFDIITHDNRVRVVDSNECLDYLMNASLEPAHFNPVYYLGVDNKSKNEYIGKEKEDEKEEDDEYSDILTAELGPAFGELSSYLRGDFDHE
ncbi:unnamed protein product [Caenorhabditis angaria]|uniref:Uncharacterized protein n=1 Tax=Caenorhabditis angaria TaxID=860376 RepID=A0A9P1IU48_9PELO|nr:unnamed protein product [Caenorhabditis angaria]